MYCPSLDSISIRANGSLSCWDDYGFQKTLIEYSPELDYVKDVYWGEPFNYIRRKIANKEFPFPEFCKNCLCMQFDRTHKSLFKQLKEIRIINVEPTITCHLDCPGCTSRYERKNIFKPPFFLDYSVFEKMMTDFSKHLKVHNIIFGGNGEPLNSEATWEMVKIAKKLFPNMNTYVSTNGNISSDPTYVLSNLTGLIVSIDGVDQDSYGKYRINGNFNKAYDFMKNYSLECKKNNIQTKVIWKYILFNHNDSLEQLSKVMELALEAKIDEVRFILTHNGPASEHIIKATEIPKLLSDFNSLRKIKYFCLPEKGYFTFKNLYYNLWYKSYMRLALEKSYKLFRVKLPNYTSIPNISQQVTEKQEKPLMVSATYYFSDKMNLEKALNEAKINISKNKTQQGIDFIVHTNNMIPKLSNTKINICFKNEFKAKYLHHLLK